jgi:3-oxoacyl-[acyl-carrier-protein] synthase II
MNKRVVITGLGVISSIGIGKDAFWNALLQGKSGISPITSFDTTNYFTHIGGEVKNFKPYNFIANEKLPFLSRATQFAFAAAKLAIDDANLDITENHHISVCLGTTNGPTQAIEHINDLIVSNNKIKIGDQLIYRVPTNSAPAFISNQLKLSNSNFIFSTACAAGNYAIGYGYDQIVLGKSDIVLAGGADPFIRFAFAGFNQFSAVAPERCQPFDKNRKGMVVAEGACIIVLESLENALKRNAPICAELIGYGLSCDAFHMTTPSIEGVAECMKKALRASGIRPEEVDYISAHGTGTVANDKNECAAIKDVFGTRYKKVPISSIKSMLGHSMGAASALEAAACALVVKNDVVPPTINFETPDPECDIDCVPNQARNHTVNIALNNSYAFGGNNACVVFSKYLPNKRRS